MGKQSGQTQRTDQAEHYQTLLKNMKDPNFLRQQAEAAGLKVVPANQQEQQQQAPKKRERPTPPSFEEDEGLSSIATKLVTFITQNTDYVEGKTTDEFTERDTKAKTAQQQARAAAYKQEVDKFVASKKDFFKYYDGIKSYTDQGIKVQEAYRLARLDAGVAADEPAADTEDDGAEEEGEETPPRRSSMDTNSSDEAPVTTSLKKKPNDKETTKQAAERNMDLLLKDHPEMKEILKEQ